MVIVPPELKKPPPKFAVLPEMLELMTLRLPSLLKAPPFPVVCAPEISTPEMNRFPPEAMLKMLKSRLVLMVPEELSKPLILRKEAPKPLMVRVPTVVPVPPVPEAVALASKMVGNDVGVLEESSVMV